MLLVEGGKYILLTLNSFYFRLYTKDIFLGLVLYVRVRIYYALARNLALLAILISTWLVSAILYSRYYYGRFKYDVTTTRRGVGSS